VNRKEWSIKAGKKANIKTTLLDPALTTEAGIEIRAPDKTIYIPIRTNKQAL
jgi:hypothetical protein